MAYLRIQTHEIGTERRGRWMSEESREGSRTRDLESHSIHLKKLTKNFDGLTAVSNLDMRISKGTLYGLIGPNGSGKTTTIRMLVGLLKATSGEATILGEKIPIRKNIARISYMPQETAVYSDLTVYENLETFAGLYSMDKESFARREDELLSMIDMVDRGDSLVSQLSGGMRHRTSLACSLIHDPEIMFLDEPTVGVDPELRVGFWKYFSDLKANGKTIIITTHYMDEANRCDIVGMMRMGRLIAEGTPKELLKATKTQDLESAFLASARGAGQ
jgi:ABC-2 type transport system ATP-binding protein